MHNAKELQRIANELRWDGTHIDIRGEGRAIRAPHYHAPIL